MVQPTSTNNTDIAPTPTRLFTVSPPQHLGSLLILYHRIDSTVLSDHWERLMPAERHIFLL